MDVRALHRKHLLAAVLFLASTLVLAVQLITPTPVVVSVGENGTEVAELGGYFRYVDVAVVALSATILGGSGVALLRGFDDPSAAATTPRAPPDVTDAPRPEESQDDPSDRPPSDDLLESRRQEWEETADRLADNERAVYETVLAADGVLQQAEIVDRTDLSKATVSRMLDSLESKQLLERKRRGMGNVVVLR